MKEIDTEAVAYHIRGLLEALGDDPDREGLKETPQRVARMYEEVFEGMKYTNEEIAQMFDKTFSEDEEGGTDRYGDMVVVKDIDIFSYCEHHLALMYDMKVTVAYVPNGKVIGLSKIARIADMAGQAVTASGTHRHGYCGYYYAGDRLGRRSCLYRRLPQLHDGTRNPKDEYKNIYTDTKREISK